MLGLKNKIAGAKKLIAGGLDLLWGGLLFGGYALGTPQGPHGTRIPVGVDLMSSLALVGAAWTWRSAAPKGPLRSFATRMALGMSLGAVGDVGMKIAVPAGMAAFGAGHVAYIAAMLKLSDALGGTSLLRRYGSWGLWIGIGLVAWYLVVHLGPKSGTPLAWAGLAYCLLLASTVGVAMGLTWQSARGAPLLLGAVLFLLSDLIIAMKLFNPPLFEAIPQPCRGDIIWLTYGPAQALLANAVFFMMSEPRLRAD
jgi:hypothetical protein